MDQNRFSTEELFSLLFQTSSLPLFLEEKGSVITLPVFHEYIASLCAEQNEVPEHIIQRAGLEKSFGHQLFSGLLAQEIVHNEHTLCPAAEILQAVCLVDAATG